MKSLQKFLLGLLCTMPLIASAASTFDVAHFREQNTDIIAVVLPSKVNSYPSSDKKALHTSFEKCARSARMSGNVVMVWPKSNGAMGWYGPTRWSNFMNSLNMKWIKARVNKELTCS